MPSISERVKAVELLVDSYQEAAGDAATAIQNMQKIEREIATSVTEIRGGELSVTVADAQILTQFLEKYGGGWSLQVVLPLVKKQTPNVKFTVSFLTGLFRLGEANKLWPMIVRNLFKDILGDVIADLHFHYQDAGLDQPRDEFVKRRRLHYDKHESQAVEDQRPKLMSSENLVTIFGHCQKLVLSHEIDQLVEKIISQAPNANPMTFERVLIPLLKNLPPPIKSGSKSIDTHSLGKLFRAVLTSYINTYVKTAPQKPTGWERQPRGCSLCCNDCVELNTFLKDSNKYQASFSVNGKRRDHLQERVNKGFHWTETIRSGTPYTLVVQKNGWEWERAMKDWKQRCGAALKAVEDIGFEKLRGLLGEGWEDVVGLRAINAAGRDEDGERRPLGSLAQGKGTSGVGVGERVAGNAGPEIIDLDCE